MTNKYDYVRYDPAHVEMQNRARQLMEKLDKELSRLIDETPVSENPDDFDMQGRFFSYCSKAEEKLEEAYMYFGKAIRDHQIMAGGCAVDITERG